MSYTHTHKRAERRARNIAGAEALAVARRPEVASREKKPAAAGIRRFFSLSKKSKEKISALVITIVMISFTTIRGNPGGLTQYELLCLVF